ncbi:MAG TPA: hypothetical protein VFX79_03145 [Candidatus Saccharimonadales bacterium]|nr:hypothetical protein [Candidatus Saccharimonadales bacterium]
MEHRTERLEIIMGRDDYWHDLITEPDIWEMPMKEKISVYGDDLARKVALGEISVKHLRQAVRLTNMLEAEVHHLLEPYSGDVMSFDLEERLEAEYRWFAHHVFKDALGQVKSQSQRIGLRNRVNMGIKANLGQMPGMGSLEGHDIQALREEAEKVE